MGRPKKTVASETIEQQIEKAQVKVEKAKASYDSAVEELQSLLQKRDTVRKDELWTALQKSGKSYEDILGFLKEQ